MSNIDRFKLNKELLTRAESAEFLGLKSKGTLDVWACNKTYNLPYVKVGRLVRYRKSDLLAFIESRTIYPNNDKGGN